MRATPQAAQFRSAFVSFSASLDGGSRCHSGGALGLGSEF
jgi:hypothetical protein